MKKILLLLLALALAGYGCVGDEGVSEATGSPPASSAEAPAGVFELSCITAAPLNLAIARFTQSQGLGSTLCVVQNGDDEGNYIFSAEIPEWTEKSSQTVFLAKGERKTLEFSLTFKDKAYKNRELQDVEVHYAVEKDGKQVYSATQAANITSATQLVFGAVIGNETFFVPFLAAQWVTPNDPCIEKVIAAAKELMPGRAFSDYQGYAGKTEEEKTALTMQQAKAVYETLQAHGMSYVNSLITFGDPTVFSQNVRLPFESLETKNANCIDGTALYAAVFEKIGLEPIIVLVPGHAFVGVRNDRNSSSVTFIETTATGTKYFEEAAAAAEQTYLEQLEGLRQGSQEHMLVYVDVAVARSLGVTPFPTTHEGCDANITTPSPQAPYPYQPTVPAPRQVVCSDGTPSYQCSATKPLACIGGILFPDCFDCGCPPGLFCFYDGNCYSP